MKSWGTFTWREANFYPEAVGKTHFYCGSGSQSYWWTSAWRSFEFLDGKLWVVDYLFLFREVFFDWSLNILKTNKQKQRLLTC